LRWELKSNQMNYQSTLDDVHECVRSYIGKGKVANYIPALANISPDKFGMALRTVDGQGFSIGDAEEKFSIQSISKVFTLTLAMNFLGERLWKRVGKEPSGDPFNSLVQLEYENGIPRNPLINPGAIVVADCLLSQYDNPKKEILSFLRKVTDKKVNFDRGVARSERETGFRNIALANLMKGFGNLDNDVEKVLDVYFHQCSLSMSCVELAHALGYLANSGVQPESNQRIVSANRARRINALMLTCGTYDRAGEFAFSVGLPAKSGVGGGIVAIVPDKLTVCVWSPALGASGNSVAGMEALKRFVKQTALSVF